MPSIPSITGSHPVSSIWPASVLTPGLPSPHLTIDQANSMYKLATECQTLGIKLAKKFQVLSSLEAIHHNFIQGTAHEMLTMGHSAQEAAYFAVTWDRVPDDEHEVTTHCLHSEADVAWKEMHEVMYNHQLHNDGQLATFLTDPEMALNDMCGEVWNTTVEVLLVVVSSISTTALKLPDSGLLLEGWILFTTPLMRCNGPKVSQFLSTELTGCSLGGVISHVLL